MAKRAGAELQGTSPKSLAPDAQEGMKAFLRGTRDVIARLLKEFPKKLGMDGLFGKPAHRAGPDSTVLLSGKRSSDIAKQGGKELKKFNSAAMTSEQKQMAGQFHKGTRDVIRRLRTDFPSKLAAASRESKPKASEQSAETKSAKPPEPRGALDGAEKAGKFEGIEKPGKPPAPEPKPPAHELKPSVPEPPEKPGPMISGKPAQDLEAPKPPEPAPVKGERPPEEAQGPPRQEAKLQESKPPLEPQRATQAKGPKAPEPQAQARQDISETWQRPQVQPRQEAPAQQEEVQLKAGAARQAPAPPMEQQAQQSSLFIQRQGAPIPLLPRQLDQPVLGHLRGPEIDNPYEDEPRPGYYKKFITIEESEEEALEGELRGCFDGYVSGAESLAAGFLEGDLHGNFQGECGGEYLTGLIKGEYAGAFQGLVASDVAPSAQERDFSQPIVEVLADESRRPPGDASPGLDNRLVQGHLAGYFKGTVRRDASSLSGGDLVA
jgi:hypothetical protein